MTSKIKLVQLLIFTLYFTVLYLVAICYSIIIK